jgi:hypothetical protein
MFTTTRLESFEPPQLFPMMVEGRAVAPRRHGGEDLKSMPLDAFVELMKKEATPPY